MNTEGNDEAFGPVSASRLDFTLLFEHTVLGILPTGLLLATTPLYFYICARRPLYTRTGYILWAELVSFSYPSPLLFQLMSALLSLYIITSLVIDVSKSRSYFIRHELQALGSLSAAAAATKILITILQEVPKRHLLMDSELRNSTGREATGGFFYRNFFGWLNSIFATGFYTVLKVTDLEELGPELASRSLYPRFLQIWKTDNPDPSSGRLAIACLHTLWWHFLAIPLPRLLFSLLTLAQPFLLRRILDCISNDDAGPYERAGLIAATLLTFATRAIARGSYKHASYRLVTAIRGVLIAAMADKQMRLTHTEAKKSAISTLMTADVEGIEATLPSVHDLWAFFVDIGFGLYFLSRYISLATISIFAPFLSVCIEAFTPVIILTAALLWTTFPEGFTAFKAFPILALIAIVQMPLFFLIETFSNVMRAWACFNRIQAYLQLPEWKDPRRCSDAATSSASGTETLAEKQNKRKSIHPKNDVVYEFIDAWIVPSGSPQSILKSIDMQIMRSRIIALLGPIACGKSTFLRCLLGEADLLHGAICVTKKAITIAYCDQTPWLHNGTLRDNILGPNPYEESWYRAVVRRCQLVEDFDQLSNGDESVVGSDGMNLSLGQRHRVSLARAVYARPDVVLADGIFSSQDQVTARAIMKQLLGADGLLRQSNTTVVLATHLSVVLDVSDEALVFDGKGNIARKTVSDNPDLKKELVAAMNVTKQMSFERRQVDSGAKHMQEMHLGDGTAAKTAENTPPSNFRTRGDFGLYQFYFSAIDKTRFILWIVAMIVVTICDNFPSGYVRIRVDKDPKNNLYLLGFALLALGRVIIGLWSQRVFYLQILPESGEQLHQMLLDALTNSSATLNYICAVDSGDLLNRFSQDMSLVVQALPLAMYKFVFKHSAFFHRHRAWLRPFWASYATIALPFVLGIVYAIQKYYLRTSRQLRHLDLEAKTPLFVCFKETANGLLHIRTLHWSEAQLQRNLIFVDDSQKPYYQMFCAQRWLVLVLDSTITAVAVIIVGVALNVKNSSSPAAIGLAYLIMINFGTTVAGLIQRFTEMEISLGSISRTRAFVENMPREQEPKHFRVPDNWPDKGKVEFRNVTAKYNSDSVLTDVSFVARPGDKVGIIGRSGSGKSSLLLTLLNFLEYSGSIIIDGVNISKVPHQLLRERITTITQTPVVIDDSIRYNLVPWDDNKSFPDSVIKHTLRQLGLWEHIKSKRGLQASVESAGLSAAHLELLCIARAILHHIQMESKIVLMDEATASLSAASDLEVQRVMKEVFQGCTVFNVAHWDSPLQVNDLELFIEKGKLENAWRLKSDEEDEEAAEEKLARDEDETAYLRRLLRKEDQEQREILAREQAFEAKAKESTIKEDGEKTLEGLVELPDPTEGDASKVRPIHPLVRAHGKLRAESPKDATGPPAASSSAPARPMPTNPPEHAPPQAESIDGQ
ncbi:ABC multidrug transporter, putative [Beauveria bassiana ARSEF 2860]|uniref:ABC multidrug transporter, putative n=1 Tax=Beauveria bassiana (strain ARSEF 2860) TaxID=655819 RepID=J5JWQ4_BEAB2|nr:ABC multidrug transporter, putative [Beauveria bassiana ARSEF 2860]EJP69038.1 ABC multidrug transporter, putative [Beauveria bassiana ARSEF 2860]